MKKSIMGFISALLFASGLLVHPAWAQGTATGKPAEAPASAAPAPQAQAPAAQPGGILKDEKDKISYALGLNLGAHLRRDRVAVDPNLILQGIKDALAGGNTLMTDEEAGAALAELQNDLRAREGAMSKQEGEAFLAANKSKEGVVTLSSGLQYKILTQGTGPKPGLNDSVVCNYQGTLINGTEFDSSYKRGQPLTFPLSGVIKGWTEALQLMPVGSKWQLFIPSDLAYGEKGAGPSIPPGSTLIFQVELLSIKGK